MKIILAQGNPGSAYNSSRHNVGFMVVDDLAEKLGAKWDNKPKFDSTIAELEIASEKVILVKPNTFYNETGTAAQKIIDFYKLNPAEDLLVIHDDLALPFGTIRVRKQGSGGGNNGVKSLNAHLENGFMRIRIGIDNENHQQANDVDFVLSKFSADEAAQLQKTIICQTIELIDQFCNGTIEPTSFNNPK